MLVYPKKVGGFSHIAQVTFCTRTATWRSFKVISPVEVGRFSHYLQGFIHPRWLFGISSINSITLQNMMFFLRKKIGDLVSRPPDVKHQRVTGPNKEICALTTPIRTYIIHLHHVFFRIQMLPTKIL